MLPINKDYLTKVFTLSRYGTRIDRIVIHGVGVTSTALNNAKYYRRTDRPIASIHYFVDDTSIYASTPEELTAQHCSNHQMHLRSIAIELCHTNNDITAKTLQNALELIQHLMEKYHITSDNVIRHFDVNGKNCPARLSDSNWSRWNIFKTMLTSPVLEKIELPVGSYIIASKMHGKVLDLRLNDGQVLAHHLHGGENQRWHWDGESFTNHASNTVLDVLSGKTDRGLPLICWEKHGGDNQNFNIAKTGEIIAKHSNLVLDIAGANHEDGAMIMQWTPHSGQNQQWIFIKIAEE